MLAVYKNSAQEKDPVNIFMTGRCETRDNENPSPKNNAKKLEKKILFM